MIEDVFAVLAYLSAGMVFYYGGFFALSLRTNRRAKLPLEGSPSTRFVIVVPAHNEELVIEQTVRRLRELRSDSFVALVMNDGSGDRTGEVARRAADGDERIVVVDRAAAVAGRGKGAVLNHAYRLISRMVEWGDPRLGGARAEDVVIGVVDADGWLEPQALREVSPYFDDPAVGGVQLPVRIWNSADGFLPLMQDIEFLGFCRLVQAGRDPLGSVGLGGNGQFARLSALQGLGDNPWSDALTEDLDLTMRLIRRGWRLRFCPRAAVAQQGLTRPGPLFRQRARWVQGHYACWHHVGPVLRARRAPLFRRVDAAAYLLSITLPILFFTIGLASAVDFATSLTFAPALFEFVSSDLLYAVITTSLALGPLACIVVTYRATAANPVPFWAMPGVFLLFIVYGYAWSIPATARALARIALRRGAWAKTDRVEVSTQSLINERHALGKVAA